MTVRFSLMSIFISDSFSFSLLIMISAQKATLVGVIQLFNDFDI